MSRFRIANEVHRLEAQVQANNNVTLTSNSGDSDGDDVYSSTRKANRFLQLRLKRYEKLRLFSNGQKRVISYLTKNLLSKHIRNMNAPISKKYKHVKCTVSDLVSDLHNPPSFVTLRFQNVNRFENDSTFVFYKTRNQDDIDLLLETLANAAAVMKYRILLLANIHRMYPFSNLQPLLTQAFEGYDTVNTCAFYNELMSRLAVSMNTSMNTASLSVLGTLVNFRSRSLIATGLIDMVVFDSTNKKYAIVSFIFNTGDKTTTSQKIERKIVMMQLYRMLLALEFNLDIEFIRIVAFNFGHNVDSTAQFKTKCQQIEFIEKCASRANLDGVFTRFNIEVLQPPLHLFAHQARMVIDSRCRHLLNIDPSGSIINTQRLQNILRHGIHCETPMDPELTESLLQQWIPVGLDLNDHPIGPELQTNTIETTISSSEENGASQHVDASSSAKQMDNHWKLKVTYEITQCSSKIKELDAKIQSVEAMLQCCQKEKPIFWPPNRSSLVPVVGLKFISVLDFLHSRFCNIFSCVCSERRNFPVNNKSMSVRMSQKMKSYIGSRQRFKHRIDFFLKCRQHKFDDPSIPLPEFITPNHSISTSVQLIDPVLGLVYTVHSMFKSADDITVIQLEYIRSEHRDVNSLNAISLQATMIKKLLLSNITSNNVRVNVLVYIFDEDSLDLLDTVNVNEDEKSLNIVKQIYCEVALKQIQVIKNRSSKVLEETMQLRRQHIQELERIISISEAPKQISDESILDFAVEYRLRRICDYLNEEDLQPGQVDNVCLQYRDKIHRYQSYLESFHSTIECNPLFEMDHQNSIVNSVDSIEFIYKLLQFCRIKKSRPPKKQERDLLESAIYTLKHAIVTMLFDFFGNVDELSFALKQEFDEDFQDIIDSYRDLRFFMMQKGFQIAEGHLNFIMPMLGLKFGAFLLFYHSESKDIALVSVSKYKTGKCFKFNKRSLGAFGLYNSKILHPHDIDVEALNMHLMARLSVISTAVTGEKRISKLFLFTSDHKLIRVNGCLLDQAAHELVEIRCEFKKYGTSNDREQHALQQLLGQFTLESRKYELPPAPPQPVSHAIDGVTGILVHNNAAATEQGDDDQPEEVLQTTVDIKIQTIRSKLSIAKLDKRIQEHHGAQIIRHMKELHDVAIRTVPLLSAFLLAHATKLNVFNPEIVTDAVFTHKYFRMAGGLLINSKFSNNCNQLLQDELKHTYQLVFNQDEPKIHITEGLSQALRHVLDYIYHTMESELEKLLGYNGMLAPTTSFIRAKYTTIQEDSTLLSRCILQKCYSNTNVEGLFDEEKLNFLKQCPLDYAHRIIELESANMRSYIRSGRILRLRFLLLNFVENVNNDRKTRGLEELKVFSILPIYKTKSRFITIDKHIMNSVCGAAIARWKPEDYFGKPIKDAKLYDFFPFSSTKTRTMSPTMLFDGTTLHVHHELLEIGERIFGENRGSKRKRDADEVALAYQPPPSGTFQKHMTRGLDPGINNVYTGAKVNADGLLSFESLSKGEYDMRSGRAMLNSSVKEAKNNAGIEYRHAVDDLSKNTFKTSSWEGVLRACTAFMNSAEPILKTMYSGALQNMRFAAASQRDSFHKKLLDDITCKKTVLVGLGDGSRLCNVRGVSNGASHASIKRMAKRLGYPVILVNEAFTSKRSSCCPLYNMVNHRMKYSDIADPFDPGKKYRSVVPNVKESEGKARTIYGLQYCTCCRLTWSRDNNGALNIWRLLLGVMAGKERNPIYSNTFSQTSLPNIGFVHDLIDRFIAG